jgi:hypothetical protein
MATETAVARSQDRSMTKVESRRARGGIDEPRNAPVPSVLGVRVSIVGDANQRLNAHPLVTVAQNPREG